MAGTGREPTSGNERHKVEGPKAHAYLLGTGDRLNSGMG